MKRNLWILWGALAAWFVMPHAKAQEDSLQANRYVMRATTYGVGYTNILDTYLSPMTYTGTELRVQRESMRRTRLMHGHVSAQSMFNIGASITENDAATGEEWSGTVSWDYALHYQWQLTERLKVMAGPQLDVHGGFIYNLRNSNNPAQALADVHLGASAMAIYRFHIKRYPMVARYQLDLPLVGVMFSPEYGESYYEIFEQEHDGSNILFTTPFNAPTIRHYVSLDFPVGNVNLRVGYRCDVRQSQVNDLKRHLWSHLFMVGFVKNFYLLKGRNRVSMPAAVSPY
jgi:hypothetical protein